MRAQERKRRVHDLASVWLQGDFHMLAIELDDGGRPAPAGAPHGWPWWIDLVDAGRKDEDRPGESPQAQPGEIGPEQQAYASGDVVAEVGRNDCSVAWIGIGRREQTKLARVCRHWKQGWGATETRPNQIPHRSSDDAKEVERGPLPQRGQSAAQAVEHRRYCDDCGHPVVSVSGRERVTGAEREAPSHDATRIHFWLGAHEMDRRVPILELLAKRNHLARHASAVTKAAVVEQEHYVSRFCESNRELANATVAGQTEAVAHHDTRSGRIGLFGHEEPSAADIAAAPQLHIGLSHTQALRLGDLRAFIKPTTRADELSELNELRWLVEGDSGHERARAGANAAWVAQLRADWKPIANFHVPAEAWTVDYYGPLQKRLPLFRRENAEDEVKRRGLGIEFVAVVPHLAREPEGHDGGLDRGPEAHVVW